MSKEYKFSEAIEIMKPGDVFSPNSSKYGEFRLLENGSIIELPDENELILCKELLFLTGVIIPAKKEMVSAEDFVRSFAPSTTSVLRYPYEDMVKCFEASAKNRDLLYAPLMDAVEHYMEGGGGGPVSPDGIIPEFDRIKVVLVLQGE